MIVDLVASPVSLSSIALSGLRFIPFIYFPAISRFAREPTAEIL